MALGRLWGGVVGPGRRSGPGRVESGLRHRRGAPPAQRRAPGRVHAAGHGDRGQPSQDRGRAGRDRPGGGHAPDRRRRAGRHHGLPRRGRHGPRRPPRPRPGPHRDLGAHLGGVPPCDDPSGRPPGPRPRLVANLVRMGDERGGWKGLDTGLLRDHLHAATAVGRMAAAAKAVELGYGIEADPGPSGRLGGWAIAGIPREAWEVHATRSAQIDEAVGPRCFLPVQVGGGTGHPRPQGPRAGGGPGGPLAGRAGPGRLPAGRTGRFSRACRPRLPAARHGSARPRWPTSCFPPAAGLASEKTFTRDDVVVAVAPMLHGLPVSVLDRRR